MLSNVLALARRIRRSNRFKSAAGLPKRLRVMAVQRANKGVFSIEIESRTGFFAIMQMVLFILVYCEEKGLFPDIGAAGGIYGEPTATVDWFRQLFDGVRLPDASTGDRLARRVSIRTSKIKDLSELGFRSQYEMRLSLSAASDLFNRTYRPTASVCGEVDSIAKRLGISSKTLAVHYRGTDKVHEAKATPWPFMCEAIEAILHNRPDLANIFLATDDGHFSEYLRHHPFKVPVITAPAQYLPKGNVPIHFSGHPGLAIGREALITCLLLARCGFLLKTASYLSAWAKIFNPALDVWLISPSIGLGFFPDRALWADQISGKIAFPGLSVTD
jgi:hypothetical protein